MLGVGRWDLPEPGWAGFAGADDVEGADLPAASRVGGEPGGWGQGAGALD
jgi:hypothetical protein